MKRHYIFCIAFISFLSMQADESSSNGNQPTIVLHVHNNNQAGASSGSISSSANSNVSSQQVTQQTWMQVQQEFTEKINIIFNDVSAWAEKQKEQTQFWIYEHKFSCIAFSIAACYVGVGYQIYSKQQILNDPTSWCNWKKNYNLEELFALPVDKIEQDLLQEIQRRYTDIENPTDFMYSLIRFARVLQDEIEALQQLQSIFSWIQCTKTSSLFLVDTAAMTTLQTKIHKISFYKHIFLNWCANYKISKNN